MSNKEFSIYLGSGLYIASSGELSRGPVPDKPFYPLGGGGLPLKPEALEKVLTGIQKALPNPDDPKSREKLGRLGVPDNLIHILGKVAQLAGAIASVIPVVGFAVQIINMLGLFKEGPTALELLMTQRFDELEERVKSLEKQIALRDLRNQRNAIGAALARVGSFTAELKKVAEQMSKGAIPDLSVLAGRHQHMRDIEYATSVSVRNLLDASTYLASFDRDEHKSVWPWIQNRLYLVPPGAAAPLPAMMPAEGANAFDHRLMIPMATYAIESYITLIQAISPEYRSTREYRDNLYDFADMLDMLAINMRKEVLARTIYKAADFTFPSWAGFDKNEVIDGPFDAGLPRIAPHCTRFTVGALDLRSHNDLFFRPGFSASTIGYEPNATQGSLNVRWIPPASLEKYEDLSYGSSRTLYRITNPVECAAAANAQSELDYADLLISSGYLTLAHLAATIRHDATDPDRSQTVTGKTAVRRKPLETVLVTVESDIRLTGLITSSAQRQPQRVEASSLLTTQPIGRPEMLSYRIMLRTLHDEESLNELNYDSYYSAFYRDDPAKVGFKRLYTFTRQALGEAELASGKSVAELRIKSGMAALNADTFDWWIPVETLIYRVFDPGRISMLQQLRSLGWTSELSEVQEVSRPLDRHLDVHFRSHDDLRGWEDGATTWQGGQRVWDRKEVKLEYNLSWQGDQMSVTLKSRPEDRNYIVYLVVEETLGSGEILHTAQRIPVNGQLTFVPQEFFEKEFEAIKKHFRALVDLAHRVPGTVVPENPNPPDPIIGWIQPGDFASNAGLQRLVTAAQRHQPELLRRTLMEHGIDGRLTLSAEKPV